MFATRYSRTMMLLHWLTVLVLTVLFVAGLVAVRLPLDSPIKPRLFRLHAVLGYVMLFLTLARLVVKFRTPQPTPPSGMSGLRLALYRLVHGLLYLLMLAMSITGVGILVQSGLGPWPFFDVAGLNLEARAVGLHLTLKLVLLALVFLHVAGVFSYQWTKGPILHRMGLGKGR